MEKDKPKIPLKELLTDRRIIRSFIVFVGFLFGLALVNEVRSVIVERDWEERESRAQWLDEVKRQLAAGEEGGAKEEEPSREISHELFGRYYTIHNQLFEVVWVYLWGPDVWLGGRGRDGSLYEHKALEVSILPKTVTSGDLANIPQ